MFFGALGQKCWSVETLETTEYIVLYIHVCTKALNMMHTDISPEKQ